MYIISTTPKRLLDFSQQLKSISYIVCTRQYFFSSLGIAKCFFLADKLYDHYAVTYNPLDMTIMSATLSMQIVGSYITGIFGSSIQLRALTWFLWTQCYPSFLLWPASIISSLLLWNFFLKVIKLVKTVMFDVLSVVVIMISYGYIIATEMMISSVKAGSGFSIPVFLIWQ